MRHYVQSPLPLLFHVLVIIIPAVFLGTLGSIFTVYWLMGHPDPNHAVIVLIAPLQTSFLAGLFLKILTGIWGLSIFSIWLYIWNFAAFHSSEVPEMREKLRDMVSFAPIVFWRETRDNILKAPPSAK
jgi:hypothetical protein